MANTRVSTVMVDAVVKLGGGLLAQRAYLDPVLETIAAAARTRRLLVVPGGGPFADAVRDVDRRLGLSDDAAHWMAILAMDQMAHLVASRLTGSVLVTTPDEIAGALERTQVPVLAPSRWLRNADPLPHSWDVTSDSIAAWVAAILVVPRLVLIKPSGVRLDQSAVDAYFPRALGYHVTPVVVAADDTEAIRSALAQPRTSSRSG
jgi:5-(aminomethyl)-3-furanmethanol phosphate kinase